MKKQITKKIAIVTGASSGLGSEFVKQISKSRALDEIWVIARRKDRLEEVRKLSKVALRPIALDLTEKSAFDVLRHALEAENPDVRFLVNAAGVGKIGLTRELTVQENDQMIDLNCRALAAMTQIVLPYMQKGAQIIEIASVAAFQPIPYINIYGATKAFVLSYARALNRELKQRKIHVLALCPFWTRTRFFDRAIQEGEEIVVKNYAAMYEPEFIVKSAWRALRWKRDFCVPGWKAKLQVLCVKILPHRLVMTIWQKQQKLK